jgi:dienelactone hydrolase
MGERFPRAAWIPIAGGLAWLWCAGHFGVFGFLCAVVPGALLLSSGVGTLLYPGDIRIPQFAALGGFVGVLLALPILLVAGLGMGALLLALSALGFVAAGHTAVIQELRHEGMPDPIPSLRLSAEVAVDEALLATMTLSLPYTDPADLPRLRTEVEAARELYRDRGWLEKPLSYHVTPPPLTDPEIRRRRVRGMDYEHLRFASGFEPRAEEPRREAWLRGEANRTAHAWALRHADPARPWLVCIHGYQMGDALIDLSAFEAERLHRVYGMNLLFPVLPLHGPRKIGRRSGDGYLAGEPLDTVHAVANAMWDLRRLLSWIRAQGGTKIGVHGLSLGGFHTALLACLDDGLACAIPGIPLADVTRVVWRHGPPLRIRHFERNGVVHEAVSEVLRVVSPLALEPRVPKDRRYLYAAVADRLVPADQVYDLWRHWDEPEIVWYQGGHVSFRFHPEVRRLVDRALLESGLRV